jgi:hypothetical protein
VSIVALNRRFHQWNDTEPPDPEMRRFWGLDDGGIGWEQLLTKRRAVVLAEAGSGKSTEFAARAKLTARSQAFVFDASVEDVGREGLDGALSVDSRTKLAAWRQGVGDAWFFIDSVDEAKVAGIKFERVLRKLAEGIHGAEGRCHILLSGRVTDWEPRRDLEALKRWLPVSSVVSRPEPTPKEELLRIIRNEGKSKEDVPPNDEPFVAIMAQLDRERIRIFAETTGMSQPEQFLMAIEDADLWHFARRPLDLDWLVLFWQDTRRLGALSEMLERSVSERLKETNPDRTRSDAINLVTAVRAVERVGAAMVFGRQTTIAIPDCETASVSDASLDLADILPDWPGDDRIRLLTRPIFDPATFGRVRFHNDNDGTVRSYLAARWLVRLREANLATGELFRLLFASSYGMEVIRPSVNETAAWLCLWDKDVANEVVRRAPGLLLSAGDPASLSANIRSAALGGLLHELTADEQEWPWWDNDTLQRFAQADLAGAILSLWPRYRTNLEAARLLIRLIWLGSFKDCEALIRDVAFDRAADPTLRVFAGRALLAIADTATHSDYAVLICTETATVPLRMARDAIVELFPTLITSSDVLRILACVNIEDDQNGFDFERYGAALVKKLGSSAELELFLTGLMDLLGTQLGDHSHHPASKREAVLFPAMAEAATRLLKAAPSHDAPDAAIDALLRIGNRGWHAGKLSEWRKEALVDLHGTAERRRRAFWRVVSTLRTDSRSQPIDHVWHVESLGYPPGLKIEDVDWLLVDGLAKGGADCRLAVNAAMSIYQSQGQPASLLAKIAGAVEADRIGRELFHQWTSPYTPSQFELDSEQELRERDSRYKVEQDSRDQSWIKFIKELQEDPDRIAKLALPVPLDQRSDLLNLYLLLHWAGDHSHYAIDSVAPLRRIAGHHVAEAVEAALIAHWRRQEPMVRSDREPQERNTIDWPELMGLAGVTLEAAKDPAWTAKLSDGEARRATQFATLEMNGFPRWLSDLVKSRPEEVETVLHHEIKDELTREGGTFFETLQAVSNFEDGLASLLAPRLLQDLEASLVVPPHALSMVLRIIVHGLAKRDSERFTQLGLARFQEESEVVHAVHYLAAVFSINPSAATSALFARATALDEEAQTALVDQFLIACFGDSIYGNRFKAVTVPPPNIIEDLMLLSFKTHKQVIERKRPPGVVYMENGLDHADQARSAIFNRFVKTPGAATYYALRRLQEDPTLPVPPIRLRYLAEKRALEDSELYPWPPGEAYAFERSSETEPRTGKDLRSVAVGRIEDIQHELLNGDFCQRQTFKGLAPEKEVQKWVADRLRLRQGRSFSVEREPHVLDEKEPDIRLRAKATDVCVAMEIKVAESWTLTDLDDALAIQLCGRYLRSDQGRYGILLLVHQESRSLGWEDKARGTHLSFTEVVDRLRARALAISGESHSSPQPEVAVLDVSVAVRK